VSTYASWRNQIARWRGILSQWEILHSSSASINLLIARINAVAIAPPTVGAFQRLSYFPLD